MPPHASAEPQDLATEDVFDMFEHVGGQLAALDDDDIETVRELLLKVVGDVCAYALALAQNRLAEAMAEDQALASLGPLLMDRPPGRCISLSYLGVEVSFLPGERITVVDIARPGERLC